MAKTKGVWGIDIGQSALKALRCHRDESGHIIADSYDFIEYPKSLSLPDADEESLVSEALDTFLSRNEVRGDFVAMTVSGQSGLSRFFKPPPVDARTLPDIVKYEVRQQIPFPIDDVIWDWQSLGGSEMDNVIVDAEVGLFAIKRDTVYSALQPFMRKDIEVDLVQLSPLAVQNVVCHELLGDLPEGEEIDMDSLPDPLVILSMGTDATDLIITNGVKLWLRNIPIGGNHFTKELSRELKLTHAKAEHLKRNARQAEDPKTVFQAMRRVFNDLKKEIDRSLSYYSGMDKNAQLEQIVLLGNAARLPGLRQYLNKQLEMDIAKVTSFDRMEGPIKDERVFKENVLSFAPAYGLCLQGLDEARVDTNLLPAEFVNERIIRAKKPWVLASVSLLMLGMLFSYFFVNLRWWGVHEDYAQGGVTWEKAVTEVETKKRRSDQFISTHEQQTRTLNRINEISAELSEASETQAAWPEFLSAIDQLLPRDPRLVDEDGSLKMVANPEEIPFEDREEIYVDYIESKYVDDLGEWLQGSIDAYRLQQGEIQEIQEQVKNRNLSEIVEYDLSGLSGFIVELKGHHFYNSEDVRRRSEHGSAFLKKRLLAELISGQIELLDADGQPQTYKPSDIGIYYPVLVDDTAPQPYQIPNPNFGQEVGKTGGVASGSNPDDRGESSSDDSDDSEVSEDSEAPEFFEVRRYDFWIQMVFIPTSPVDRDVARAARLKEEAEIRAAAAEAKQKGESSGAESDADSTNESSTDEADAEKSDSAKAEAQKDSSTDSEKADSGQDDSGASQPENPEGGQPDEGNSDSGDTGENQDPDQKQDSGDDDSEETDNETNGA